MNKWKLQTAILLIILTAGCKEAYDPPALTSAPSYLVVEGFINNGQDSTYFNISRTNKVSDTSSSFIPERSARVTVEGKDNSSWLLYEVAPGKYASVLASLNNAIQYRLHIVTSGGKEYASDYVTMKTSPPIDSVNWGRTDKGIQFYVNTHDPAAASKYYRWDFVETWNFHSLYYSSLSFVNGQIVPFYPDTIYSCWKTDSSTNILLGSSVRLAKDEIYQQPVQLIPSGGVQLSIRYSIRVRQFVLSPEAFTWWQTMQKNTEQIGSVFGVQPTNLAGNIHSLSGDSTDIVVGYVSGGTLSSQRIFVTNDQVQPWNYNPYACDKINTSPDSVAYFISSGYLLIAENGPGLATRYDMAIKPCIDCTTIGVNHPPSFW